MTATQTKLIRAASRDNADDGTRWRDRTDAWLEEKHRIATRWLVGDGKLRVYGPSFTFIRT